MPLSTPKSWLITSASGAFGAFGVIREIGLFRGLLFTRGLDAYQVPETTLVNSPC